MSSRFTFPTCLRLAQQWAGAAGRSVADVDSGLRAWPHWALWCLIAALWLTPTLGAMHRVMHLRGVAVQAHMQPQVVDSVAVSSAVTALQQKTAPAPAQLVQSALVSDVLLQSAAEQGVTSSSSFLKSAGHITSPHGWAALFAGHHADDCERLDALALASAVVSLPAVLAHAPPNLAPAPLVTQHHAGFVARLYQARAPPLSA